MRDYVTPPSLTKKKGWASRGLGVPTEGSDVLGPAAKRLIASGPGRTGRYKVERHELEDLEKFIERHPERLSLRAKASVKSLLARRMKREWWNVIDKSENQKLGGFAATYGPVESCPASCAMRGGAPGTPNCDSPLVRECFGGEHNTLQQWTSMQKGAIALPFRSFLRKLRKIHVDTIRVNVIGDLPGDPRDASRMRLDAKRVLDLARAASAPRRLRVKVGERRYRGKMIPVWGLTPYRVRPNAFTYTHYDPTHGDNYRILRAAIREGLNINLSADSLQDADRKARYGDVAVVVPRATYKDRKGRTRTVSQGSGRDQRLPSITTPEGRTIFWCQEITTSESARREARERLATVEAFVVATRGMGLTKAEKEAITKSVGDRVIKTCATCSPSGPACAWRRRKKIIGFLAHGTHGAARNFTAAQARDLLMSPNISPLDRKSVTEALARAEGMRAAEARKAARSATRVSSGKTLMLMRANPRRRNMTATRASAARARLERLKALERLMPVSLARAQARRTR